MYTPAGPRVRGGDQPECTPDTQAGLGEIVVIRGEVGTIPVRDQLK